MAIDGVAFLPHHVANHFDARFLKDAKAFARHNRVRVNRSDHHACDAVRQNQGSARRLRSDMAAGFKRVDDRGASQIDAVRVGIVERHTLRMRATIPVMVSGGENLATGYHHRAYQRIRVHPSRTLAGQFKSLRHIFAVLQHVFHDPKHIAPVQAAHVVPHIPKPTRTVREWTGSPSRPSRSHATLQYWQTGNIQREESHAA